MNKLESNYTGSLTKSVSAEKWHIFMLGNAFESISLFHSPECVPDFRALISRWEFDVEQFSSKTRSGFYSSKRRGTRLKAEIFGNEQKFMADNDFLLHKIISYQERTLDRTILAIWPHSRRKRSHRNSSLKAVLSPLSKIWVDWFLSIFKRPSKCVRTEI